VSSFDLFSIQPIDRHRLLEASLAVGRILITVEDHASGGLGNAALTGA